MISNALRMSTFMILVWIVNRECASLKIENKDNWEIGQFI